VNTSPALRQTIKGALEGDSSDAEHDALVLVADELAVPWHRPDDQDDTADETVSH
jgi:hypothetical protein